MRSIWKGHIRFLLVAIPIRVYNAIEASERIQFNQLHRDDFGPIGYDKRCKKCGQIVRQRFRRRSSILPITLARMERSRKNRTRCCGRS